MRIYSQEGSLLGIFSLRNANAANYSLAIAVSNSNCLGNMVSIVRTYQTEPYQEVYTLYSASSHLIYLQDVPLGLQVPNGNSTQTLCLPSDDYILEVGDDNSSYWECGSYAEVVLHVQSQHRITLIHVRFDSLAGEFPRFPFSTKMLLSPGLVWEFSLFHIPSNWWQFPFSEEWGKIAVGYKPSLPSHFHFYRNTFTLNALSELPPSITIYIRFLCGCVIVINNQEVYRRHLPPHELLNTTYATACYEQSIFRSIAVSTRNISSLGNETNFLRPGVNSIVVALVNDMDSPKPVVFDMFVLPQFNHSLLFHYHLENVGFSTDVEHLFDACSSTYTICKTYRNASITIIFNDDRRELVSYVFLNRLTQTFVGLTSMVMEARNPGDLEWTELALFENMMSYQAVNLKWRYLWNTKAWNQIRFSGMKSSQTWILTILDVQYRIIRPDFTFTYPQNLVVYSDSTSSFIYPSSLLFSSFTATGDTSAFIIDTITGGVMPITSSSPQTYSITITAESVIGITSSFMLIVIMVRCNSNVAFATLCVNPEDSFSSLDIQLANDPSQTVISWSFFDTTATSSICRKLCFPQDSLILSIHADIPYRWKQGHGFVLTSPNFKHSLYSGTALFPDTSPFHLSVKTVVSGDTPCWLWNKKEAPVDNWKDFDLDDHEWSYTAASVDHPFVHTTQYFRYPLHNINADEFVYQCIVSYNAGVAVYVNGDVVAVFNLPLPFDHNTFAINKRDKPISSTFSIIMEEYYTGSIILTAELHKANGSLASSAVFTLECVASYSMQSFLVSSLKRVSAPYGLEAWKLTDYDVTSFTTVQENRDYNYEVVSSNVLGIAFNALIVVAPTDILFSSFTVYGEDGDQTNKIASFTDLFVSAIYPGSLLIPAGLLSFPVYHIQFRIRSSSSALPSTTISEIVPAYIHFSGPPCKHIEGFPWVREGQISPGFCPSGMTGYAFRVCQNGVFTPIDYQHCELQVPTQLQYTNSTFVLQEGISYQSSPPSFVGIITDFSVEGSLPEGLMIDSMIGVLYGMTIHTGTYNVAVVGSNSAGYARTPIVIIVNPTLCSQQNELPQETLGSLRKISCDGMIGDIIFQCVIWQNEAVWVKKSGHCISYSLVSSTTVLFAGIIFFCVYHIAHAILEANRKKRIKKLSSRLYSQTIRKYYVQ